MSNGLVHDEFTKDLQLPFSIAGGIANFYVSHNIIQAGAVFITILAGIELQRLMTPDLDIISNKKYKYGYYPLYMLYRDFGYIPYWIWRAFWTPYAIVLPHRSIFSHGLIIGTFIRLLYLFIPFGILLGILYYNFGYNLGYLYEYWPYLVFFITGFFIADCGHLILDYILPFRRWYESILGENFQWHNQYHSTIDSFDEINIIK